MTQSNYEAEPASIDEQLARMGLRRACEQKGEPGWYVLVTNRQGKPIKVWATDEPTTEGAAL